MVEYKKIEKEIISTLKQIVAEYFERNKSKKEVDIKWVTSQIKEQIGVIGYNENYDVASSVHDGEWLYDLIWYTKDSRNNTLTVPLVLESEISDRTERGLKFDFEKLLLSKSEFKVFICMAESNYNSNSVSNVKEFLQDSFMSNQMFEKGERVLLLIWDDYETGAIKEFLLEK